MLIRWNGVSLFRRVRPGSKSAVLANAKIVLTLHKRVKVIIIIA